MNPFNHLPKILFSIFLLFLLPFSALARNGILLYTPYTKISVPPGETIAYAVDVKNTGGQERDIDISLSGFPKDWTYYLKSGGFEIQRLYVHTGNKKTINQEEHITQTVHKDN